MNTHTHTLTLTVSGSERQGKPPHMKAGLMRTAESPHTVGSDLSILTKIHSCNWSTCKSKLSHHSVLAGCMTCRPEKLEWNLLCTCQTAGGQLCWSKAELFRSSCLIPLKFFFIFSPCPGLACSDLQSPRLSAKNMAHPRASKLTHTLMLTYSWFITWDKKDNSFWTFARFQSKQLSLKYIQ